MPRVEIAVVALIAFCGAAGASGIEADARRGAAVFERQRCTTCHAATGKSTGTAPNFERRFDRNYTPAGVASRMWNHAPRMWAAIGEAKIDIPRLTEVDAADLFAFFYARGFFEQRGDGARGERVFQGKCSRCHAERGPGKPLSRWKSLADSVELVERLWNHSPEMVQALDARKKPWPELTPAELTDLLVYVQSLPHMRTEGTAFELPNGKRGKALLASKGCTGCHRGSEALEGRLGRQTLTMIAASMWNHTPVARAKAADLSMNDMREILAYVWSTDFYRSRGDVADGRKIFSVRCEPCHGNPSVGAPDLKAAGQHYTAITMVWALWTHGPKMLQELNLRKQNWPELSEVEMDDLIAFLDFKLRRRSQAGINLPLRVAPDVSRLTGGNSGRRRFR